MTPPQWRIQTVKSLGGEQWSNDYLTSLATLGEAHDLAIQLVTFEENIHQTLVHFDYYRVSSYVPFDRIFQHLPINANGLYAAGDYLPLYNTLRIDFATAASDPARKYYRVPIREGDQQNGILSGDYLAFVGATLFSLMEDEGVYPALVTTAGNTVQGASPHNAVQMRQLHRHRRPRVTPPA